MLKWCYFALVAAFLGALLWMVNDTRQRLNGLVDRLDQDLPPILMNSKQATQRINDQLPRILKNSQQAAEDINALLPQLLKNVRQGIDHLAALRKSFGQLRDRLNNARAAPRSDREENQYVSGNSDENEP